MVVTVVVVVLVILAMLRWIEHLSDLGSMDATLSEIEAEARSSLMQTRAAPSMRANPLTPDTVIPTEARPVPAPKSGYLQIIDVARINSLLGDGEARVYLHVPPGRFVLEGQAVAYAFGLDESAIASVQSALTFGQYRTFEQDSAYGLLVLSEIASRALSPGINDAGTAIDVIARQERLIWEWATTPAETTGPGFPRIFVPELHPDTIMDDAFASTARDGADKIEVVRRLLHALRSLTECGDDRLIEAARAMARRTRDHAEMALVLDAEREEMRRSFGRDGLFTPSP